MSRGIAFGAVPAHFIETADAAQRLGLRAATVCTLARRGVLTAIK